MALCGTTKASTIELEFGYRAQTNIQLFNQLIGLGFGTADLAAVYRSYTVATRIFTGQMRPEGRPFICHVVGVASILADLGQPIVMICAGLLHSAYTHGDFGAGRGYVSNSSKHAFRRSLNPQVHEIIDAYARQTWNAPTIRSWITMAKLIDNPLRAIITIRLADALEDALDFGLQYCGKGKRHSNSIPRDDIVCLAQTIGIQRLTAALRYAYGDKGNGEYFQLLRTSATGSAMLAPLSYRRRMIAPTLARIRTAYWKVRKASR
jgi:(p)ppGpp synthase/HD superfamily hydrolase